MKIFGFDMEFDHNKLRKKIEASKERDTKGYICVIDGPSLARSYKNSAFMELLQNSYANTCDGGSVAFMASHLCKRQLKAYTGPEIFADFITQTEYRQIILGNEEKMFAKLKDSVENTTGDTHHLYYIPLPFSSVDNFDYESIAQKINSINADLIWVSLGAPKQEFFMQKMLPHLRRGVMLGVGAAFSFYLGELKDYSFRIGEIRLNWIFRLLVEPKKQFKRVGTILQYYPLIYYKAKRTMQKL